MEKRRQRSTAQLRCPICATTVNLPVARKANPYALIADHCSALLGDTDLLADMSAKALALHLVLNVGARPSRPAPHQEENCDILYCVHPPVLKHSVIIRGCMIATMVLVSSIGGGNGLKYATWKINR